MRRIELLVILSLFVFDLSGCSLFATPLPTPTFPPTISPTVELPPALVLPPTQELPTLSPTSTPFVLPTAISPMTAISNVDNLVLRSGPSVLFENLGLYKENVTVTIMAKSQGEGWYFVLTSENMAGWMKSDLLTLQGNPTDLPYFSIPNANLVCGHVRTSDGTPASGIGVSIAPVNKDLGASIDAAVTDASGTFYLFIPASQSGKFQVGPNGYNCEGNLVVGNCELPYLLPASQLITLPADTAVNFEFVLLQN